MIYFDHVHRLFKALNPHTAENVRPLIDSDKWAMTLSDQARDALECDVRSLDPENLDPEGPGLRVARMTTLPANVYVVLAMNYPVVFVDAKDAIDYANLTDSRPVHNCALRSREDAAELMYEFEDKGEDR